MYEEHLYEYDIFCKHQSRLVNQGYKFCSAGHDIAKCQECEYREPEHVVARCSSASTEY